MTNSEALRKLLATMEVDAPLSCTNADLISLIADNLEDYIESFIEEDTGDGSPE